MFFLFFALFFGVIFDLSQVLLVFLMFYTVFRGSGVQGSGLKDSTLNAEPRTVKLIRPSTFRLTFSRNKNLPALAGSGLMKI